MTHQEIEDLRKVITKHNREHVSEFKITFTVRGESVTLEPPSGDTIYYGEVLAKFVAENDLELIITVTNDHKAQAIIK